MKIELKKIKIRDLFDGYQDDEEDGVVAYHGLLNVRPPYQREFIYKESQQEAVIDTIMKGYPLNVMYWATNPDGTFELMDGQQRTISICQFVDGVTSIKQPVIKYFHTLTNTEKESILDYELTIYFCNGTDKEKLEWFKTINIAGEELTIQELRNAIYTGPWLMSAKTYFSKTNCIAYKQYKDYMAGSTIRQDYLETALQWICDRDGFKAVEEYMAIHQNDKDANDLKMYFNTVMDWVKRTFPKYRKEMKGIDWGILYNKYNKLAVNPDDFEKEIKRLMMDDDVTRKKGIYEYLLSNDEKHLSIRTFTDSQKRQVYEMQKGICPSCKEHFEMEEMEADHIDPWSQGGPTTIDNCQMLCKKCNRRKSDK